jgi:hypothetical protein
VPALSAASASRSSHATTRKIASAASPAVMIHPMTAIHSGSRRLRRGGGCLARFDEVRADGRGGSCRDVVGSS